MSEPDRIEWNNLEHSGALEDADSTWCDHPACPLCAVIKAQIIAEGLQKSDQAVLPDDLKTDILRFNPTVIPMSPIERDTLIVRLLESFENRLIETLSHSGAVEAKTLDRQAAIETRLSDLKVIEAGQREAFQLVLTQLDNVERAYVSNKKYVLEALQAQDYYTKKAVDEILKRFDALAQEMMVDRIAAASRITSKNLGIPKRKKRRDR